MTSGIAGTAFQSEMWQLVLLYLFGSHVAQPLPSLKPRTMGCSLGSSRGQGERQATVVKWRAAGESHDEVSINVVEPTLSLRSMEQSDSRCPGKSTHHRHVAKLEKFLKTVDAAQLEEAVQWKRCDHLVRML